MVTPNNKRIEEPMILELNKKEIQRAMSFANVTSVSKDEKETPLAIFNPVAACIK